MLNLLVKLKLASKTLETVFRSKTATLIEVIKYRRFIFFGPKQYSVKKIGDYDPKTKIYLKTP